jgi:hypothetical protein
MHGARPSRTPKEVEQRRAGIGGASRAVNAGAGFTQPGSILKLYHRFGRSVVD